MPEGLICYRCKREIPLGPDHAIVQNTNGRGVTRFSAYHVKCLPPNLFHKIGKPDGLQNGRVAPG